MSFLYHKLTVEEMQNISEHNKKFQVKDVTCTNCDWVGYQHELGESWNGDEFDCHYCPECKEEHYIKGVE